MMRLPRNLRLFRTMLLTALLAPVLAAPIWSQSSPSTANPVQLEPRSAASQSAPDPQQPLPDDPKAQPSDLASPGELRQAMIEAETKKLYALSADLRAEVAKTYKESLSLSVLKKAEDVEKQAKRLRLLMSQKTASKH